MQESSERDVLHSLTTRIEQLLEGSRRADWAPAEPLPSSQSPWVNALLSYLQVRAAGCGRCLHDHCMSTARWVGVDGFGGFLRVAATNHQRRTLPP